MAVLACALVGLASGRLWADQGTRADDTAGRHLTRAQMIFESNRLAKLNVFGSQNEKVGSLQNLIIDAHDGLVLYGILDTGVGGKLVPVPWNAFRLEKVVDKDEYSLALNMTKDKLANSPTFDKDRWPDFTSDDWKRTVSSFFNVRVAARPPAEHRQPTDTPGEHLTRHQMFFESSRLAKLDVRNRNNDDLGNLENLIIDAHTGHVLYGILDTGVGGHKITVPWAAMRLNKVADRDEYHMVLNLNKDQLANAPKFDKDHWPDFTSEEWQRGVNNFFNVRTAARPTVEERQENR
jgi:sporulation protein YlmC with PRC-barrel domain